MQNPEDISNPTTALDMTLKLMAKAFQLNNSTPTNNNQRSSSNPCNSQIAQSGMNMDQERQMLMVDDNIGNQFRQNAVQNVGHLVGQNAVQKQGIQNVGNKNGLSVVLEIENQYENGNVKTTPAEGNGNDINGNPISNSCRLLKRKKHGSKTLKRNLSSWMLQMLIKKRTSEDTSQQASTSRTQSDNAPIYDSDGSTEKVLQNDSNVISEASSVEQDRGTVQQHPANFEETRALYDSLYQNLAIEVEKVNTVNHKLKETNADLTTELARFKNQENFDKQIITLNEEISDLNKQLSKEKSIVSFLLEKKKKLKSDFKTRKDERLDKQIQLEKKIKELNNILVKTGQSILTIHMLSPKPELFYDTEQKMALGYQNPFYLKQPQKKQQSLYDGKVLLEKHDPPVVHDSEETLQLAQESREKIKQMNKEIKPANYTKINHLSRVFVFQTAKSREELYFSNDSKTANVSKTISLPNEEFSDDTTPSVARKFLNELQSTIVTLQRVVKHRMTLETHNWSSSAHQELHKIVKDEVFPIVNQVDARHKALELKIERLLRTVVSQDIMYVMQKESVVDTSNLQTELERTKERFENCIIKEDNEYAKLWNDCYKKFKFVRVLKSLAKEADESIVKHKALELEIERILRVLVSQDIMSVVQNNSVVDTSNLQTELKHTKERFENYIIKIENEYAKLWNDWYRKCEERKYDKILYDEAYKAMQQKIERLQAQLGDQKGKSNDTSCVSVTLDLLPQKLENENVKLEFQAQTKTIIDSLQTKLHDTIYENAKLRAQLSDEVSEQKDTTNGKITVVILVRDRCPRGKVIEELIAWSGMDLNMAKTWTCTLTWREFIFKMRCYITFNYALVARIFTLDINLSWN
nr:hypothetical protein [Tanacetum cinerariifolium]